MANWYLHSICLSLIIFANETMNSVFLAIPTRDWFWKFPNVKNIKNISPNTYLYLVFLPPAFLSFEPGYRKHKTSWMKHKVKAAMFWNWMKTFLIMKPYRNHRNVTTVPETIIGNGKLEASWKLNKKVGILLEKVS